MLMYADSLDGPWTEYAANPIIASEWAPYYDVSHVSSPDAIWNAEAGELFLYFHGENSVTRYASSSDGIHFDYGDVVVSNAMGGPGVTETSYARVFEHPDPGSGYRYGMFYMANYTDNHRRIKLAESVDGITWTVRPGTVVDPGTGDGGNVSGGNLWEWDDQLYVIYHNSTGNVMARTIDPTLTDVGPAQLLHRSSGIGEDVGRVAAPEIIEEGEDVYLFYESGDRLGATIAYAKNDPDAEPPVEPEPVAWPTDPADPVFEHCAADGSDEFDGTALSTDWDRVVRQDGARHTVERRRAHRSRPIPAASPRPPSRSRNFPTAHGSSRRSCTSTCRSASSRPDCSSTPPTRCTASSTSARPPAARRSRWSGS